MYMEIREQKVEIRRNPEELEVDATSKRQDFHKMYGILDIQPFSQFILAEKNKNNVEVIKLRMNEMYRDGKHRNVMVKASLQDYFNAYFPPGVASNKLLEPVEDSASNIGHPFRCGLIIERNGFSCLNLYIAERGKEDRSLSPIK